MYEMKEIKMIKMIDEYTHKVFFTDGTHIVCSYNKADENGGSLKTSIVKEKVGNYWEYSVIAEEDDDIHRKGDRIDGYSKRCGRK